MNKKRIKSISFKKIIITGFLLTTITSLFLFSSLLYTTFETAMIDREKDNLLELIQTKNRLLDITFSGVRESSLNLLVDQELYRILENIGMADNIVRREDTRRIREILQKYFDSYPQVVSVNLLTNFYSFWHGEWITFDQQFFGSEIYKDAYEKGGGSLFVPTYNYQQFISENRLVSSDAGDLLFSLVRLANITYITEDHTAVPLREMHPPPVLIINFRESTFRNELTRIPLPEGAQYMVLDQMGNIVTHSDNDLIGETLTEDWIFPVLNARSGVMNMKVNNEEMIICFDTSNVTGFTMIVTIPRSSFLSKVTGDIMNALPFIVMITVVFLVLFFLLLNHVITRSLGNLLSAIDKVGKGEFGAEVSSTLIEEFNQLIERFNEMSTRIKHLIEENYLAKIQQKENEITILTTQLNPHFLYNTLNIIHLSNVNGDHEQTSKMIIFLSRMLNYVVDKHDELKPLREDLDWINRYLYIMQCRYEGVFEVVMDIDDELLDVSVPKLFLQPIVENSILHGFCNMESGGIIRIVGSFHDDKVMFVVSDNGDGFSQESFEKSQEQTTGVGISNTIRRLQLMFGDNCSLTVNSELGTGTTTTIIFPISD